MSAETQSESKNDITWWAEKLVANLDVTVEDYYNHCKVKGDDLLEAYNQLHRNSPQRLTVEWKGIDAMAVKVKDEDR